jgi:photosystem II stability/assembly factor-like uncharacterized protein
MIVVFVGLWQFWPSRDSKEQAEPIASLNAPDFHSLLIDATNPDRLLFGSHVGIQESNDGGFTWSPGGLSNQDAMQLTSSPTAPLTVYATGHDVFQVSVDGGITWQPQSHNLPGTDIHGFAQDPGDSRRMFALVSGFGLFGSTDGGGTWQPLPSQPAGIGVLSAAANKLFAVAGQQVHVSADGGASWATLTSIPRVQVLSLTVSASDPSVMFAGTTDGLLRSTDGGTARSELGPAGRAILAVAVSPTDAQQVVFVTDTGDVYRSDDQGETWRV